MHCMVRMNLILNNCIIYHFREASVNYDIYLRNYKFYLVHDFRYVYISFDMILSMGRCLCNNLYKFVSYIGFFFSYFTLLTGWIWNTRYM